MTRALDGRRALVTGGASGIGRAIALAFATEGAMVAIADRAPAETTEAAVAAIAAQGGRGFGVRADVAAEAEVLSLFAAVRDRLGGLDILVNNAGIATGGRIDVESLDEWDRVVDINLMGVVRGCRAFTPVFKRVP